MFCALIKKNKSINQAYIKLMSRFEKYEKTKTKIRIK